jgi:Pyruvate/2-oxoacid:ferredoxin oxidoreductase delta subunit
MSGVARGKVGYRNMPYGASLPSKNFLMQPDPIRTSAMAEPPDFDEEACINCVQCLLACPDPGSIMFEDQEMQGINAAICKRCMRCVEVCPETKMGKALTRPDKEEEEV